MEREDKDMFMAVSRLYTAGSCALGTDICADEAQLPSQRANVNITTAAKKEEARERLQSQTQRRESLVRSQLSNVTAPSRHRSENTSSDSADAVDEAVSHSHSASLEVDQGYEQFTPHWLQTPTTGRAYDLFETERYFERAVRDLNGDGRSDSVNGEFWSHYGGLERYDGAWDGRRAAFMHHI